MAKSRIFFVGTWGIPDLTSQGGFEFSEGTSSQWTFDVEIENLRAEMIFYISRRP